MGKIRPLTDSFMVCTDLTASRTEVPAFWEAVLLAGTCHFSAEAALEKRLYQKIFWHSVVVKPKWMVKFIYIRTVPILHLFLLPLWFKTHGRKYQLKLLLIRLVVILCSAQWQVHFFSVIWRCSCSSLAGKNKPALAAASYRSKTSQWLYWMFLILE